MLPMTQTELGTLASDGLPARLTGQWVHGKKYYFCRYLDIMTHGVGRKWEGKLAYVDLFSGPGRSIVRGSQEQVAKWTNPIRIPPGLALTLHKRPRRQSPSFRALITERATPITFHRPRIAVILSAAAS